MNKLELILLLGILGIVALFAIINVQSSNLQNNDSSGFDKIVDFSRFICDLGQYQSKEKWQTQLFYDKYSNDSYITLLFTDLCIIQEKYDLQEKQIEELKDREYNCSYEKGKAKDIVTLLFAVIIFPLLVLLIHSKTKK